MSADKINIKMISHPKINHTPPGGAAKLFWVVILFLGFFLVPTTAAASGNSIDPDTNIVKYDLNDPRNPDCPCHKAQKLAEDEYRKSQVQQQQQNPVDNSTAQNNQSNDNPINNNRGNDNNVSNNDNDVSYNDINRSGGSDINTNKVTFSGGGVGSQKHYSSFYKFQKKVKKWSRKINRKLGKKNNGTKKGKFRVADCFHY
jgi:hypothetical protein